MSSDKKNLNCTVQLSMPAKALLKRMTLDTATTSAVFEPDYYFTGKISHNQFTVTKTQRCHECYTSRMRRVRCIGEITPQGESCSVKLKFESPLSAKVAPFAFFVFAAVTALLSVWQGFSAWQVPIVMLIVGITSLIVSRKYSEDESKQMLLFFQRLPGSVVTSGTH